MPDAADMVANSNKDVGMPAAVKMPGCAVGAVYSVLRHFWRHAFIYSWNNVEEYERMLDSNKTVLVYLGPVFIKKLLLITI